MKDIYKIISKFENESYNASCSPRKPPRVKTLPSYMPRSDSGINLENKYISTVDQSIMSISNRNSTYQNVSVKKLRQIWENVASDNKWQINPKNIKLSDVSNTIKSGCGKSVSSDGINKCDMIVCGIKTIIINQVKMHQIELGCHHCDSRFLMTAAHECEKDENIQDLIVRQDVQPNSLNIIL